MQKYTIPVSCFAVITSEIASVAMSDETGEAASEDIQEEDEDGRRGPGWIRRADQEFQERRDQNLRPSVGQERSDNVVLGSVLTWFKCR